MTSVYAPDCKVWKAKEEASACVIVPAAVRVYDHATGVITTWARVLRPRNWTRHTNASLHHSSFNGLGVTHVSS